MKDLLSKLYIVFTFYIFTCLLFSFTVVAQATDVVTYVSPRHWTEKKNGISTSLSIIEITDLMTYAVFEVEATKKIKTFPIQVDPYKTKIFAGNKELPLIGLLGANNTIQKFSSYSSWGLTDMKKGDKQSFALVFSGRPNPGVSTISVIISGYNEMEYSFRNVHINNPLNNYKDWKPSELESVYKSQFIDRSRDGIQGIYTYDDQRYGLINFGANDWRLLYISGDQQIYGRPRISKFWSPTDCKAQFTSKNGNNFSGTYVFDDKQTTSCTASMEGEHLRVKFNNTDLLFIRDYPAPKQTYIDPRKPPKGQVWTGTGWALLNNHIVTNYHVIDGARTISIKGINGDFTRSFKATVVAHDKDNDLAILRLDNGYISNIPYAVNTSSAEVGQNVFVLGYPMTDTMGEEVKLTNGIISSLSGFQGNSNNYQISAPVQPGNSGGPMFDENGNVIGIVVAKHNQAELASYAIKISCLSSLMYRSIGHSIFPTNNRISSMPLTEKVKEAKKYVYYIMCSDSPDYKF